MSDPRRTHGNYVLEQEDMSVFLHNLLECSSAAAGVATGGTSAVLDYRGSGSSLNFSDPACFFGNEGTGRVDKAFSSALSGDCDAVTSSAKRDDFTSSNKLQQATSNRAQPNNSKRSRSAEVHNISEKRRRSKINERLKALQNLIPNSNKTDKASMLEEAIEYLKQLQLQVQMLTIRNGLSLHPSYAPGCSMSAMQLPIDFDAGNVLPNTNRATDTLSGNQQVVMQTVFGNHNLKIPGHQLSAPSSRTTNNNFGTSFGAESSSLPNHHFGLLNHLSSSKDQCREETLPHLPLDVSCSGNNNSSSGVSS